MIDRVRDVMDVSLKGLSLLFAFCLFIGTLVAWRYLNASGLENEISSVMTSPHVLLMIAVYSLMMAGGIILIVVLVPLIVSYIDSGLEIQWQKSNPKHKFFIHLLMVFLPLCGFLLLGVYGITGKTFSILFFVICVLMTFLFYVCYGGPLEDGGFNKFKNFGVVFFSLFIAYFLLLWVLVFFLKVAFFLEKAETLQWIFLFLTICIYSVLLAIATNKSSYVSYIPVAIVALFLVLILFTYTSSSNIASRLGLGGFTASYVVNERNIAAINGDYDIEDTAYENVVILRNIWVVANLPNKLIFSTDKNMKSTYTIPTSAILGELKNTSNSKNTTSKASAD